MTEGDRGTQHSSHVCHPCCTRHFLRTDGTWHVAQVEFCNGRGGQSHARRIELLGVPVGVQTGFTSLGQISELCWAPLASTGVRTGFATSTPAWEPGTWDKCLVRFLAASLSPEKCVGRQSLLGGICCRGQRGPLPKHTAPWGLSGNQPSAHGVSNRASEAHVLTPLVCNLKCVHLCIQEANVISLRFRTCRVYED